MFHLIDLSELGQMTRNQSSKQYLDEAIAAYRAGAYRASIISTWIAVCVDIIEKIRELSLGGDNIAINLEQKLNGIQANDINGMLAYEREILDFACEELELISVIEKKHLEHLKEDRHFCVHPIFSIDGSPFIPSPELTKAYIVQASSYLLANTPVRGKVAIDRLYNLITGNSFAEDDENAFIILSSDTYLGRVKDSTVRNLVIILLKRIFRDDDSLSQELFLRICSALGAIERLYPEIFSEVFNNKFNQMLADTDDKKIKRSFPFLTKRKEAWGYIEDAIIIRLETTLVSLNGKELNKYWVPKLASVNSQINEIFQSHIADFDQSETENLLKGYPTLSLKDLAIKIFIKSGNFDSAYNNGIHFLAPHSKFFTKNDLEVIFDGILKNERYNINQILRAGGIEEVLCQLYNETKNHIVAYVDMWKKFYEDIEDYWIRFEKLEEILITDGVIEANEEEEVSDIDEVPF